MPLVSKNQQQLGKKQLIQDGPPQFDDIWDIRENYYVNGGVIISMAMKQEPIDWRYLPYIRPIFKAYVRGYTPKIWPYLVQYLHLKILKFPLIIQDAPPV